MKKQVVYIISLPILLFCWLYWGLDTVSPEQKKELRSQGIEAPELNETDEIAKAKERLSASIVTKLEQLESRESNLDPTNRVTLLKDIASIWSEQKEYYISGIYAEKIAELDKTSDAWGIAGTTFLLALQESSKEAYRAQAIQAKAVQALENAISANPDDIDHRINLALAYVELPPGDNPMKGIQNLLGLQERYPEEPKVLAQLGRLALQTGQTERAYNRYLEAYKLGLNSKEIVCLLAQMSEQLKTPEAAELRGECESLIIKE